ncbi:MAG: hypothetical protein KF878_20890 [Planctomycetes bacterium]|nr:hypothetical protein [Planctomycetota bacterium]
MTEQAPEVGGTPPSLALSPVGGPRDGPGEGPLVPRPFEGFAPAPPPAAPAAPRSEVGGVLMSLGLFGVSAFFGFTGFMTVAPTYRRPGAARSGVEARAARAAEIARAEREAQREVLGLAADAGYSAPPASPEGSDSTGITPKIPGAAPSALENGITSRIGENPRADDDR